MCTDDKSVGSQETYTVQWTGQQRAKGKACTYIRNVCDTAVSFSPTEYIDPVTTVWMNISFQQHVPTSSPLPTRGHLAAQSNPEPLKLPPLSRAATTRHHVLLFGVSNDRHRRTGSLPALLCLLKHQLMISVWQHPSPENHCCRYAAPSSQRPGAGHSPNVRRENLHKLLSRPFLVASVPGLLCSHTHMH